MRLLKLLFAVALALAAALAVAAGFIAVAVGALIALIFSLLPHRFRPRFSAPPAHPRPDRPARPAAADDVIDVTAREIPASRHPD